MKARALLALVTGALGFACSSGHVAPEPALVRLEGKSAGYVIRLVLVPAPGARINARLHPVLALEGGKKVQFDQAILTPDSSYFGLPPEAMLEGTGGRVKGILRLGVCPAGLNLCRPLQLLIDTVFAGGK